MAIGMRLLRIRPRPELNFDVRRLAGRERVEALKVSYLIG